MIGRPASAYGSAVAAARDASLRLRHHGHGRSPSPRCARRRTPPSTSVPELREAPLHRLHLRRAARSSPPPSPPTASDARADLRLLPFHGMDGSPSPPSRAGPASASAALDRAIGMSLSPSSSSPLRRRPSTAAVPCREVHFPPPPSLPRGELSSASASITRECLDRALRGMVSASTSREALQRRRHCREAPSPPLPRGELSSASVFDTRDAIDRAIRGMALSPLSAYTTDDGLQRRRPRREALSPPLPSPPRRGRLSASPSATREALDRAIRGTGLSPSSPTQEALRLTACSPPLRLHVHGVQASACSPLTQYPVTSMATMPASIASLSNKLRDQEISGPILIITNPEFSGSSLFSPYTMRTFTRPNFPIDTIDVLYLDGYFFLLKEGPRVSIWEVQSETSVLSFNLGVHIDQGYFRGTPSSDLTVVLARQRVFAEQIDNFDDEDNGEPDIVAEFWLRRSNGSWQQNAVVCAHLGIHSLIIHGDSLFWLSDDGTLCSVRQTEEGLLLEEWEGAVESVDSSFSLVEHLNNLYIVKSGGILPNPAEIYRVVPGDPPAFPETRINGKDVFIVHGKSGFLLANQTNDCRVFSAPLVEDADCARFSYTHNCHDNIRPCQSELFHNCSAAWAMMETTQ